MYDVILGVDGGGTHSKIVAADTQGHILARDDFGSLNYNSTSVPVCRERLACAVKTVLKKAGCSGYDFLSVGLSALQGKADAQLKKQFLGDAFDQERVYLDSDIYMALMGASLGNPEIMVISGTGAMCIGRNKAGEVFTRGGYGYLVDSDRGSSYCIAMGGVAAAIDSYEGRGPATKLEEALCSHFQISSVKDIVNVLYSPDYHISQGAAFAREVIALAQQGDAVAEGIIEKNISFLAQYTIELVQQIQQENCGVNIYGGLFQYNPHLCRRYARKVKERLPNVVVKMPGIPAEIGAVIDYFLQKDMLTQSVLNNLSVGQKGDVTFE